MLRSPRTFIALILSCLMLTLPRVAAADPGQQDPPGSARVFIETVTVNDSFVVPASPAGPCAFDVLGTVSGWSRFLVRFDQAGDFVAGIESRHLLVTYRANGHSVSDVVALAQKAEDFVENPDGTDTATYTFGGRASLVPGVGGDVGRITFEVTFDPNTGQELNFAVLSHSGQLDGLWSGDPNAWQALCGLLAS